MSNLIATFTREGERDRIDVRRADGSRATWACPTYGGTFPHDLVHLLVESGFGLDDGLWARVARGRVPQNLGEGPALITAEALAASSWFDEAVDDAEQCERLLARCGEFQASPPRTLLPERVAAIREGLRRARRRWRASPRFTIAYDGADPELALDTWLNVSDAPAETAAG